MSEAYDFLTATLGDAGSAALQKACEQSPDLKTVILPRAVMSWLSFMAPRGYQGNIPGTDIPFRFQKHEDETPDTQTETYAGEVEWNGTKYLYQDANLYQIAAAVALAIGARAKEVNPASIKAEELISLGKSVDVLVKAHAANEQLRKAEVGHIHKLCPLCNEKQKNLSSHLEAAHSEEMRERRKNPDDPVVGQLKRAELPGKTARPSVQLGPAPPGAPTAPKIGAAAPVKAPKPVGPATPALTPPKLPGMGKKPAAPKLPGIKVGKSEMASKCSICGEGQFAGTKFAGCLCLRALAKSVTSTQKPDGVLLTFGSAWDRDDIDTLMTLLRGEE